MLHHHVLDDRLGEGLLVAPTRLDWLEIVDLRFGMVKLFSNLHKGVRPRVMEVLRVPSTGEARACRSVRSCQGCGRRGANCLASHSATHWGLLASADWGAARSFSSSWLMRMHPFTLHRWRLKLRSHGGLTQLRVTVTRTRAGCEYNLGRNRVSLCWVYSRKLVRSAAQ